MSTATLIIEATFNLEENTLEEIKGAIESALDRLNDYGNVDKAKLSTPKIVVEATVHDLL